MEWIGLVLCWIALVSSIIMGLVSLMAFLSSECDYQDPGLFFGGWVFGVSGVLALLMIGGWL